MDLMKRAEVATKLVGGKIATPNEARSKFDMAGTDGGETLWGQHQDYPLGVLATRTDLDPVERPEISEEQRAQVAQAQKIINTQKAIAAMRLAVESANAD
jgi:hypothetical protein